MRISDWSSDVCSSDLLRLRGHDRLVIGERGMAEPVEGHNRLDAPREMPRGDERERAEVREPDGGDGNDYRSEELRYFRFQVSAQSTAQPRAGAGPVHGYFYGDHIARAAHPHGVRIQ